MYRQEKDTRYFNISTSKSAWHDLKETARSFQSKHSSVEKHLGNIRRRLEQRVYEHEMGGYHENHRYQAYLEKDSYYEVGQSFWNRNEGNGRDFQEVYETYEDSRYSYMDDGHLYPYEQEARYYAKETYESQESMKSFLYEEKFANNIQCEKKYVSLLSRKTEARKTCAQKKVRFEEQRREVRVISNEHIGEKLMSILERKVPLVNLVDLGARSTKMRSVYKIPRSDARMIHVREKKVMKEEKERKQERDFM
ncbi:hypothetical protein M9H77_30027 [Catharanthus roseus]|uniref:Uncharacterized protein n=1 Tax=Catharanthus roseus TaxID=4058 RepID=A0ACB9ZW47_CATRO|nr:hypothetical protein M9H77_30027 [Catharanthus roseus]